MLENVLTKENFSNLVLKSYYETTETNPYILDYILKKAEDMSVELEVVPKLLTNEVKKILELQSHQHNLLKKKTKEVEDNLNDYL